MGRPRKLCIPTRKHWLVAAVLLQFSVPVSQLSPVRAKGRQKVIILQGAILGFHEWRVESLMSTSRSVFTSPPKCTVCMPGWSQKLGREAPGRGTMPLGTSDSKDPTQDHPQSGWEWCVRLSTSPREPGPAPSTRQLFSASVLSPPSTPDS